ARVQRFGYGHVGHDPCVPNGISFFAHLAALLPLVKAAMGVVGKGVSGFGAVRLDGCATRMKA
ncbi:MAG: hypothetical protein WAN94_00750, partial [Pseudolabrys sp.]